MGFDMGSSQPTQPPQPNTQPSNSGFGGDLLGFGSPSPPPQPTPPPQPSVNQPSLNSGGMDLMGFGFSAPQQNAPVGNQGGFPMNNQNNQPPPAQVSQPQGNNNLGFDLFGGGQSQVPQQKQPVT